MLRFIRLALLAMAASTFTEASDLELADRLLQDSDFSWDLNSEPNYPIIAFDDTTEQSEAVFLYNYTGALGGKKYLGAKLYQSNCVDEADGSLTFSPSYPVDGEYEVDVNIIQETITNSIHYNEDPSGLSAVIDFCIRVDYYYDGDGDGLNGDSINFHETKVTIDVDLTANFTLTAITDRTDADQEDANADLDYPVEAYICGNDNVEITDPTALAQGSALQFCVRIDSDLVTTNNVFVEDILTAVLSQPGGVGDNLDSTIITNTNPDALSAKVCRENGICNVKTQLPSKYFVVPNPAPLRVDGVAILSFGKASMMPSESPTQAPGNRRLRVPITGLISAENVKALLEQQQRRALAEADAEEARQLQASESPFDLEVPLEPLQVREEQPASSNNMTMIIVAVIVVLLLVVLCAIGACIFCGRRRKEVDEHHEKMTMTSMQSSVATPTLPYRHPTYTHAPVPAPAPVQQMQQPRPQSRVSRQQNASCADSISPESMYTTADRTYSPWSCAPAAELTEEQVD